MNIIHIQMFVCEFTCVFASIVVVLLVFVVMVVSILVFTGMYI